MPAELDALILRCLAKAPGERPANARELARQLRGIQFDEPWCDEQAEAWWKAHLGSGLRAGAGSIGELTSAPTG
jgi:hypothetical protein